MGGLTIIRKALLASDRGKSQFATQLRKMEQLLEEVMEQSAAAPDMWLIGRTASIRELLARVEGLRPTEHKVHTWCLSIRRRASEASSEQEGLWQELVRVLPSIRPRVQEFLGADIIPEERLTRDE